MDAEPRPRPGKDRAGPRGGFDLLQHLQAFLDTPPPLTLLVTGASGTGKSTLLRALIPRLKGPGVFVAYRADARDAPVEPDASGDRRGLALLIVGSGGPGPEDPTSPNSKPGPASPSPVLSLPPGEPLPSALAAALARVTSQGAGFLVMDSWDAASEQEFRGRSAGTPPTEVVTAPVAFLRGHVGHLPVREIIALPSGSDPELLSAADGVIDLGWEDVLGFRLRVVSLPKLRRTPAPESRYLYTLDGGTFYCPPQFPPGFRPPIGPPPPDTAPQDGSVFPGSAPFATAFGRLRYHGLTGLEVPPRFPNSVADVFLYPLAAHILSLGGRVVWLPSASSGPLQIVSQLSHFIPPDFLGDRLRVLSAVGPDPGMGELKRVALPPRREASVDRDARPSVAAPGGPVFPEAYRFLQETPEGRPSLYVIYLDGLHALATIAGIAVNAETFPSVVGAYTRLPRFHGFGFGRADDPLEEILAASVDTLIRVEERYGRTVLLGMRPRTNPYILDWPDESGRYGLVPVK